MKKYKEISSIYKIIEIKNEYILLQINKKLEKLYIYKIEPLLFLDMSVDIQDNIVGLYNQILREINDSFQIIISNRKLDIDNYINKYFKSTGASNIYNRYVKDIKEKLESENIYETDILIIFSESAKENSKKQTFEKSIYKLEEIGCKVDNISSKEEYEELLYKHLNKI